ncbi:4-hydroxythreonine-4-phosphate dehydrogenase PdxA [Bacteroidota bacterium]
MKIIMTTGDCNGIGIEVMIKGIIDFDKKSGMSQDIDIYIAGNNETISEYIDNFNFPTSVSENTLLINNRTCPIINCGDYSPVNLGSETIEAGKLAAAAIEKAVEKTKSAEFDALITMPVSKSVLYKVGWKYPGHTEMLAASCNVEKPLMILCTESIRVGLATIHISLKDVPNSISKTGLIEITEKFNQSLKDDFGISNPNIALLGLNPHSGEDGSMGKEEIEIIIPAVKELKKMNINAFGPFPADGFFAHDEYKQYDGIMAMYHDQGLIPLKLLAQGAGVNVTAVLPIVRTSPDHGTAFNIAGKNIADGKSVSQAIHIAVSIANNRNLLKFSL